MTKKITWVSSAILAWQTTCMMKLRSPWKIIKGENEKVKQDNGKLEKTKSQITSLSKFCFENSKEFKRALVAAILIWRLRAKNVHKS